MKTCLLLFLIMLMCAQLHCQVVVYGKVKERGKGISGYTLRSRLESVMTGTTGTFSIQVTKLGDTVFAGKTFKVANGKKMVFNIQRHRKKIKYPLHGGCCFAPGTTITMKNGVQKNIEDIGNGDTILTVNTVTQKIEISCVTKMDVVRHDNLVRLEFDNCVSITCTDDHPLYVMNKGWSSVSPEKTMHNTGIGAQRLEHGSLCLMIEDNQLREVRLINIKTVNGTFITYNISGLSCNRSYFANCILVSNEESETNGLQ